jgi:iron(II)-dependent oxidoreductase
MGTVSTDNGGIPLAPMLTPDAAVAWYDRNRARSAALFDLLAGPAYYSRPIALRHPIVFYEGHLPAFSFNTLVKKALGQPSIDTRLETLFARGIDPDEGSVNQTDAGASATNGRGGWPSRSEVRAFAAEADARVRDVLRGAQLDQPGHVLLDRGEAAFTILEHEAMHHETLLYMWHRLPFSEKRRPLGYQPRHAGRPRVMEEIEVPGGQVTLGVNRGEVPFGWDNEFPAYCARVATFSMDRFDVTNRQFFEFIEAGGYRQPEWWTAESWAWLQSERIAHPAFWEQRDGEWYWRAMFEFVPLPATWPVYVSHAEASAYARWRGKRLPTEAEFQRAAYGSRGEERPYAWGEASPSQDQGVFDFSSWDPEPVGSHPHGASAWGIEDLVGNGWEWTSTPFAPFPGFRPMTSYPEYSADFFDGEHMVIKGASPATASELIRPTFRNWFRVRYPYVYATFRTVSSSSGRH